MNDNKEIIGDDYPTYEDSVSLTFAERDKHLEIGANLESEVAKLKEENKVLKHRLACIEGDIQIIGRHIENTCADQFEKPSLNEDGSVYADCAWHNVSNIEIACDLNDDSPLEWGSEAEDGYFRKKAKEIEAIQNKVNKLNNG